MRFAVSAAAILAFVSSALAQTADFDSVSKPEKNEEVAAGSTYVVTWTAPAKYSGKVSISLLGGNDPSTLQVVDTVATGVDNAAGKYSWSVGKTLGSAKTYGLKFIYESDESIYQFSQPFQITGGVASSSGSGSSSTGSATSGSASSSAYETSTKSSSSAAPTTTVVKTTFSASNTTATTTGSGSGSQSTLATTTSKTTAAGTSGTSNPSTIPTNAAGRVAAGSVALVAGVAAAVFAL